MGHREKLKEIYSLSSSVSDINNIPGQINGYIATIAERVYSQKGLYTVLITLIVHKILHPEQDIRCHQSNMPKGFSGRTVDTQYITPTLKELRLPSMAESGWLTRSLEQASPYTLDYNGHISDKQAKNAFLNIIDYVQKTPNSCTNILRLLFNKIIEIVEKNKVAIIPLANPESLTIEKVICALNEHFSCNYKTAGGAKLPVIAFYAIYNILLKELDRFKGCHLAPLGSHVACDRSSKSAGDIQIFRGKDLFEAIEIKLDRPINKTIVGIAAEKIVKYNPKRYYIFSSGNILSSDKEAIKSIIDNIKTKHGCQIILNGIIPSLKYYLRLISSLDDFITKYSELIFSDEELKKIHKNKWNALIGVLNR